MSEVPNDFSEDDEPVDDVVEAFERAAKGVTGSGPDARPPAEAATPNVAPRR